MGKTCYLPYKGLRYGARSQFGMKILILGESHYEYEEEAGRMCKDDKYLTRRIFRDFSESAAKNPFRRAIAAAALGRCARDVDAEAYGEFWKSVSMYNYVRRLLRKGKHVTETDLRDPEAAVAFTDEVLPSLRPDLILVFSGRIWRWLRQFGRIDSKIEREIGREAGWYKCGASRYALAVGLTHPSHWKFDGENPLSQHKFIAKALAAQRRRKRKPKMK